ncbi:LPXTG cell wall anchor domain-containing protein, partial [Microbacterium sp.]
QGTLAATGADSSLTLLIGLFAVLAGIAISVVTVIRRRTR